MNSFLFIIILALTHVLASKSLVVESVPFFWEWDQNENTSWDYPAFTKIFLTWVGILFFLGPFFANLFKPEKDLSFTSM